MKLIDSHCHLNAAPLLPQLDKVLLEAKAVGVQEYIVPGVIASQWQEIFQLGRRYNGVYCAIGLHPLFLQYHDESDLLRLEELCRQNRVVAIGEIGLDFYHGRQYEQRQQQLFEAQLAIATKVQLPVILHVRKAHDQILATLRRKKFPGGGAVHAFNGSLQQAEQYIGLGFSIGIGGAITYDRAKKLRALATQLPEQAIILETDSPDMVLAGKGDSPNLPRYLLDIVTLLAKLRKTTPEKLGKATRLNTKKTFHLQ